MFKLMRKLICILLVAIISVCGLFTILGYGESRKLLNEKPISAAVSEIRSKEHFTPAFHLPSLYTDAVVAAEDHRFRVHFGIDPLGIARALMVDFREKELKEGGSTITQQLVKNIYFPSNRDLIKKIAEAFIAVKMERELSKDEILELYVNNIYFGDGYYCVYDAAMGYFNKTPDQMNGYECTMLAGIPNAPSVYAPTKNPDLAEQRRKIVIRKMKAEGYGIGDAPE